MSGKCPQNTTRNWCRRWQAKTFSFHGFGSLHTVPCPLLRKKVLRKHPKLGDWWTGEIQLFICTAPSEQGLVDWKGLWGTKTTVTTQMVHFISSFRGASITHLTWHKQTCYGAHKVPAGPITCLGFSWLSLGQGEAEEYPRLEERLKDSSEPWAILDLQL